ncbi:proteasome subunit beta [Halorussus gelatinilyticus]|uniref:proteasome endopeptidase complex n=1 Tax=Halorussus gelatinilyticus TaxID=2937524 RepID=A0A8U0II62_9EURY|nr:proteasome subunit beta [Halorussus gelatinilyticus]UPW00787.1 proteasome subunit beta [Halorussus gelatinilyticus]
MPDQTPRPEYGASNGRSAPDADPELTKTGTTTVAVTASDAVVVMADRRASAGGRFVTSKDTQKVEAVHPTAAVALSGAVGSLQDYTRRLRSRADQYEIRRGDPPSVAAFATYAGNLLRNGPYRMVRPILGGVDGDGPQVYDLDGGGAVMDAPYAAKGSGTQFALGVLEREFRPDLSTEEATAAAARAVESAIERDTASGNGVTVAEITAEGVAIDAYDDPADLYDAEPHVTDADADDGAAGGEEVA